MLRIRYPKTSVITRRSKRSTQHYIRSEEISPILVRKKISFSYGPQTVNHIARTEERYSNLRSRTITKMCITARCVPIWYRVSFDNKKRERRLLIPLANTQRQSKRRSRWGQTHQLIASWVFAKNVDHMPVRFCQECYGTWWQLCQISILHRILHCILANVMKLQSKMVVYCGEFK